MSAPSSKAKLVILIVDDDPCIRTCLSAILRKEGYQVLEAQDGMEGYNKVVQSGSTIALLLTDVRCPGWTATHLQMPRGNCIRNCRF